MNRKSVLTLTLTAAIGVASITTLYAAPRAGEGRGAKLLKFRDDLGVTAEQKKQLRAVVVAHRSEIAAALRPIVEDRRALKEAMLADPVDELAIRAAADKLGKDVGEAALLAAKLRKDVAAILTPEQLHTLGDFGEELGARVDAFLDRLENGGKR